MTGLITVTNEGAYRARFSITYDLSGHQISNQTKPFTAGVAKTLRIPDGATNITLVVEDEYFIASWRTIFTENFKEPVSKCYKIGGATLKPSHEEVSCN